jgi:hypothetical protein
LRCSGGARGCLAVVVGWEVVGGRGWFGVLVIAGRRVHRHGIGVVLVGWWCWLAHVGCYALEPGSRSEVARAWSGVESVLYKRTIGMNSKCVFKM